MSITRRDQCNEFRLNIVKLSNCLCYSPPYDQAVTANPQTPEKLPEGQCPPLPAEIFPFAAEALTADVEVER